MRRRDFLWAAPTGLAAAGRTIISGYDLWTVKLPFAERVREAWIQSWVHQKRDQTDYVLTLVRLRSSDGLEGIGETKLPRDQSEALLKKMIGRPAEEFLLDDSLRGILIAVYDLVGKAQNKPVAALFHPQHRKKIVQTWWSQCFPPALMASEAKLGASLGYRVHKVKARPWEDPIAQAGAICEAIPKDMKVWVDANSTWGTVEKTIEATRELAKFPNYFAIESPIPRQNLEGYRSLKGRLPLKISEHVDAMATSGELEQWTREKLLDAWISGAPKLGRYVKDLADRAPVPIWIEHSIDNGIAQVFQAHQTSAYPAIEYAISITHVLEDDCMKEPFAMQDGYYTIPSKPGLGVSLDMDAIDRYRIG